jgi:hypothetical protein
VEVINTITTRRDGKQLEQEFRRGGSNLDLPKEMAFYKSVIAPPLVEMPANYITDKVRAQFKLHKDETDPKVIIVDYTICP